jgi:hypothetical protein
MQPPIIAVVDILDTPNETAHPWRPLVRRNFAKNRDAAAVECSTSFGLPW